PAVANGALYFASQEGTVYAVDMASGAEEWRFAAGGNTIDPLAYSDGLLYVASGTSLYALDANSGEQVWVVKRGDWFGPLVSGGVVYAANDDLNLYALDAETGAEVWKAPTGARPSSPAALAEGIIYSGTTANQLVAFDARTGQQLWKFDTDDWPSNPSVVSGVVYVGTTNHENREGERHLYAIDARSGQELWRFKADSRLFAPPAFADGVMYLQSWHGKIYALDASIAPASPTTQATLTPSSASASPTALASATRQAVPTVALPGSGSRTFPETGKTVRGLFLDYWDTHGGLPQQGFPISEVIGEVSDLDGKPYTVQYFERAVFEYHPENQPPYNVLLSQLGTFQYRKKYPNGAPNQQPNTSPGSVLFPETGKRVGGRFLQYWQQNGGLAQQGFPISDEFIEKSDLDGKTYRVQYFERAVFEMHPENQPPFDVLLSQLGTFQYREKYGER
ncbi:MAG TPA: PQQ-binding-like beta-propeller repeat protein, partial [Chloroflexia bacterium]